MRCQCTGLGYLLFHALRTCMTRLFNPVLYIYNRLPPHDQQFFALEKNLFCYRCVLLCAVDYFSMSIDLIIYFSSLPYRLSSCYHMKSGLTENSIVFLFLISLHFRHFCSKTIFAFNKTEPV